MGGFISFKRISNKQEQTKGLPMIWIRLYLLQVFQKVKNNFRLIA